MSTTQLKKETESNSECEICHKTFTDENTFGCAVCGKTFNGSSCLAKHYLGHMYQTCKICNLTFQTEDHLSEHLEMHSKGQCFTEQTDDDRVTSKLIPAKNNSYLRTYNTLHVCEVCNRKCSTKHQLQIHLRTHTGEKTFSCVLCRQSFRFKTQLKEHYLEHTGERPHSCDFCNRSFMRKADFTKHVSNHYEKRLHVCLICDQSFSLKEKLVQHSLIHTRDDPVQKGLLKTEVCA